jgi:hypothetical protein
MDFEKKKGGGGGSPISINQELLIAGNSTGTVKIIQ